MLPLTKMRFQAWCSYEGKERKMFDSEISGCTPLLTNDECLACCDSTTFEEFLISSPGEWRIKVSSVATGSCASLDYENEATFTVPTPEGWEPQPIYATLTSLSTDISQAVGFEVPPAYLALGGSILIGGIAFKILRKKLSEGYWNNHSSHLPKGQSACLTLALIFMLHPHTLQKQTCNLPVRFGTRIANIDSVGIKRHKHQLESKNLNLWFPNRHSPIENLTHRWMI